MAKGDGLESVSSGIGQVLLYTVAIVFVLLVLAGVAVLIKYAWQFLAA